MKTFLPETEQFSNFDLRFAEFICKLSDTDNLQLFLAAALTTRALRDGHVCCDLEGIACRQFQTTNGPFTLPQLEDLIAQLKSCQAIGTPGLSRPLIIENTRLYLYRYWQYEQNLAQSILLSTGKKNVINIPECASFLRTLSEQPDNSEIDWQKTAAAISLLNQLTIICGGPGTGKTTTVAKILGILNMSLKKNLRIALAAPTGKAAARLSDSIQSIIPRLKLPDILKSKIPYNTQTIHRLLGTIPYSADFRYNSTSPLPYDIILVDEASMIDLALMSKLVSAVPPKSRLILLGDRDQLSSVEAGSVLGDICDTGNTHQFTSKQSDILKKLIPEYNESGNEQESLISDCIVSLKKSYRFNENSGIGTLSRAVNLGDINSVINILESGHYSDCTRRPLPAEHNLAGALRNKVLNFFSFLSLAKDTGSALDQLDSFKILCAARHGSYGVSSINKIVISILANSGLIPRDTTFYHGLPFLINENDYASNLYNGDSGIFFSEQNSHKNLQAVFRGPQSTLRVFQPRQLLSWEVAYSMTVHKSQGSEFDHIILILPPVPIPVLTRELIYTALTRARKSAEIWCTDMILEKAITARIVRQSGLKNKLWSH